MRIEEIAVNGYKNLKNIRMTPSMKSNIIFGENANGKTNLIEALWLCSGCKSFRGTRDRDFIGFDENVMSVQIVYSDRLRKNAISISSTRENPKEKRVTLNGVPLVSVSKLFGNLKCMIFTPDDVELSKGSPENRRTFLDYSVSQIRPGYVSPLSRYNDALAQRNAALKEIYYGRLGEDVLEPFDLQLSSLGSLISLGRIGYFNILRSRADAVYNSIAQDREKFDIRFQSSVFGDRLTEDSKKEELEEIYFERLKKNRSDDVRLGFTQAGIHRDDIYCEVNGRSLRDYGSQGQFRSASLSLKLAGAQIVRDSTGETPIVLLDDVLSELDYRRQRFVIDQIADMQIFITCCDPTLALRDTNGTVYSLIQGEIKHIIY